MRVQLVNTSYGPGGASQIVANLDAEFRRLGVDTNVLVADADPPHGAHVREFPRRRGVLERGTNRIANELGLNNNGILGTFGLGLDATFRKADVVNLHNLHGGYFNFLALPLLTRRVPAVLTLHDMWPFTGHCVYSFECDRWKTGCGTCPYPNTYPQIRRDATRLEHRLKRWSLGTSNVHVVAISSWIRDMACESILGKLPIHHIPNGIDLQKFRPREQSAARAELGLPPEKRVILYAARSLSDPRKGFDLLIAALAKLPEKLANECVLLVMGEADTETVRGAFPNTVSLGFVADEGRKSKAFAAADVVAFPTRADNLPIVLQESLACGRPVVSFAVGGIRDLVRHCETGFVAEPEQHEQFAHYLQLLLENSELRAGMGQASRALAEAEFSLDSQARSYLALFDEVVGESHR